MMNTPSSIASKYQFISEIGHGAQGKIFKAIRLADNKTVVIKQLNINSIKTWKEYELFHREAQVLKSLRIDEVAEFYDDIDCLEDNPPCSYIVQEYIPGESLKSLLESGHRFEVSDVYDILIQTLIILYKLHNHNPVVIHRDIKPSNLMISKNVTQMNNTSSPDESELNHDHSDSKLNTHSPNLFKFDYSKSKYIVHIIDFGAVANPQVKSGGSTLAGTFGFMPPEQLMGHPVPASDIYAIAAVAVQMFCGKSPADMPTKDFRLIFEPFMQDKPEELIATLRSMLEPNASKRLCHIPEIIEIFENYKNGNFTLQESEHSPSIFTQEYNQALIKLHHIGQSGTIEAWQQLPDITPRRVPANITKLLDIPRPEINVTVRTRHRINILNQVDFIYQTLIEHGKKAIATITSIKYLPASSRNIKHQTFGKHAHIISKPEFSVKYTFNPPDDLRKESLIHEFITHTEPENHYYDNDCIPILYYIERHFSTDTVYSMPFPFPLDDISSLYNIIDCSDGSESHDDTPISQLYDHTVYGDKEVKTLPRGDILEFITNNHLKLPQYLVRELLKEDYNHIQSSLFTLCYAAKKHEISDETAILIIKHQLLSKKYEVFHPDCIRALFQLAYPHQSESTCKQLVFETLEDITQQHSYSVNAHLELRIQLNKYPDIPPHLKRLFISC